jgi:DUF917 family protein
MTIINKSNYKKLIKGASLFTTGGGLSFDEQIKCVKKLKNFNIPLKPISEFSKDSFLCTAAEVGLSDAPPISKKKIVGKMLDLLVKVSGKKISGIYPPEIGQESIVLEAAHFLKLPIADFDPVGFRAVPYVYISIFNLKKLKSSFLPLVACSDQGEVIAIDGKANYERTEEILRKLTVLSKTKLIFILAGLVSVKNLLKNHIANLSLSKAMNFGDLKNKVKLVNLIKPKLTINGKVIARKEFEEEGFSARVVTVEGEKKDRYRLVIMNEVMFVLNNKNKIISSVPERVLLINPIKLIGFQSGDLEKGVNILVVVLPPEKQWQTIKAHKLFGKERFSFLLKKI